MEDESEKLKALGLRVTPQRLAILDVIRGDRSHPSVENIYKKILRKYPRISIATVYNTLSKLVEGREIQELDIDPKKRRFDPCTSLHHHFYCETCGKVYDVDYDASFIPNIRCIDGHQIEAIQLNFKGKCQACSKK
jgi:Fur family peroxide stress response transcriptional regulator